MTLYSKADVSIALYEKRNKKRKKTLLKATMGSIGYFMGLGDDKLTAEGKVQQLSAETAAETYIYILGNTAPLIGAINASTLPFMDAAAKTFITGKLVPPV